MTRGPSDRRRLLYFAPASHGGIADYARCQVEALAGHEVEVDVLCSPALPPKAETRARWLCELADDSGNGKTRSKLGRAWRFLSLTVGQHRHLAQVIRREKHMHVLFAAYAEYFSPFWASALRSLARQGVTFGSVVHDPIRDAVIGPMWWHRRSIADGYSFVRHAFLHEQFVLDTIRPVPGLTSTVIPHGPYRLDTVELSRADARARLDLPADKPVALAFGLIRDNKNLQLSIEALSAVPELHLVVAGGDLSSAGKPGTYYRELAQQLGVADRCRWHLRFIPENEVGMFFAAADFLALTYSREFRSASGVLNAAAQFRKRCLASSGAGPLRTAVETYALGIWIAPDDASAVVDGYRRLMGGEAPPRWDDYVRENSWARNAERVVARMFDQDT